MAEQDTSQERTEEATPKRLEKAREEGQVARSRELNTTILLVGGAFGVLMFGPMIAEHMIAMVRMNFTFDRRLMSSDTFMFSHLGGSLTEAMYAVLPLLLVLSIASVIGSIAVGGFLFSPKALVPRASRLNPLEGIKRMFSLKSLVELAKSVGKVLVVGTLAVLILVAYHEQILYLSDESLHPAIAHSIEISMWSVLALAASTILIALIDVPFQIWDHSKKLKMTLQEVKDEMKDTEGKPEVRGRIRQLQRELAQSRMMAEVPEADVVITNPTHYSVALKYDMNGEGAPRMVAKGADLVALKIREIAKAHNVTRVEAPILARAIYYTTEIDQEIPEGLYLSVAKVLAYVFQLQAYRPGQGRKPKLPDALGVPEEFYYDETGKRVP